MAGASGCPEEGPPAPCQGGVYPEGVRGSAVCVAGPLQCYAGLKESGPASLASPLRLCWPAFLRAPPSSCHCHSWTQPGDRGSSPEAAVSLGVLPLAWGTPTAPRILSPHGCGLALPFPFWSCSIGDTERSSRPHALQSGAQAWALMLPAGLTRGAPSPTPVVHRGSLGLAAPPLNS